MGVAAIAVLSLAALTGCERGEVTGTSEVTDVSARLHGTNVSSDPAPLHWFEYDPDPRIVDGVLTFASATPQVQWTSPSPMVDVSRAVSGLEPSTTYHYRFCIRTAAGRGLCGAPGTFTTQEAKTLTVQGTLANPIIPELGYGAGVSISVRAAPDGSDPVGTASRMPGTLYFRLPDTGPVSCLRVEGNRAAVGFTFDGEVEYGVEEGIVHQIVFVEDVGASGDRYGWTEVDEPPTECPDPAEGTYGFTAEDGDVVIAGATSGD